MRGRLRWVLVAGLAVLLLATGAFVAWPQAPDRVTRENFDRLRKGMSRTEVEAILGPPGDYRTLQRIAYDSPNEKKLKDLQRAEWEGDSGTIVAGFDNERLQHKEYLHGVAFDYGPLGNLLWRVQRQWRKWFPE